VSIVETNRLILRQWRESDKLLFAAINADVKVMEHFPSTLSSKQSDASVARFSQQIEGQGWGFWAAEHRDTGEFIGFIGINYVADGLPFAPCVDIGWRLARAHWGAGFATEGAAASLKFAFTQTGIKEVVSMTPTTNLASENVMRKLGMRNSHQNFNHPALDPGHALAEHVLYTITRDQWLAIEKGLN